MTTTLTHQARVYLAQARATRWLCRACAGSARASMRLTNFDAAQAAFHGSDDEPR